MAGKSKTKIYFWLKLDENFFKNLAIKNLRKSITGGDTCVLIYQKMLLSSLPNNGVIYFEGTLQDITQEIALNLDEKIDDVRLTLEYFSQYGLIQIGEDGSAEMLQVPMLIGQETNWNKYKREKKLEKFQPHSNESPTKLENIQPVSNHVPTDIEKEIDIELEKELKIDIESDTEKEKPTSIDNDILFKNYMDLFINFAKKNINKRSLALQTFIELSEMEKGQIITGAKNYINFYKNDRPDDESGQFSINAYEFLDNAVFKEYQMPIKQNKVHSIFAEYDPNADIDDPGGWGTTETDESFDINDRGGW
uniref:phage replisome organizer protein n=1 Tax=Lactococcus garvieae TaxID=1363 RepID=UPI00359C262C